MYEAVTMRYHWKMDLDADIYIPSSSLRFRSCSVERERVQATEKNNKIQKDRLVAISCMGH
jgi:hypothetical protein